MMDLDATCQITCPRCGTTSFNYNDVILSYCGRCHKWLPPETAGPDAVRAAEAKRRQIEIEDADYWAARGLPFAIVVNGGDDGP